MGRIFLPVTGRKHDKRSIEVASLLGLERSDIVCIAHVLPEGGNRRDGEALLSTIEAQVETYGVDCRKELLFGKDVAGVVVERLNSKNYTLGVLSIRSGDSRKGKVISERMERIINGVRNCPLILVQEADEV